MSGTALRVQGLGKRYQLAASDRSARPYRTLREDLVQWPRRFFRRLRDRRYNAEAFWALREVSFDVGHGEVVGVVGRNGAGKSTLLKILSRITTPTSGCADIYGRVGSLLEVGTGFHPELTGRENIYLSGALLGMRRHEVKRRFDEIVAFAEVERFVDTPSKHYSSGMYTRLGFAVAAHLDAEILLVDEVLAVGDVGFRTKCLGKMSEVARCGRTVVLVSHDLAAVRQLAHRCIWIDQGRLARLGQPADVIAAYLKSAAQQNDGQATGAVLFDANGRGLSFVRAQLSGDSGPGMVSMGESVTLNFELRADAEHARRPVRFAIGIRSEDGVPIALISDADSGFDMAQGIGCACRVAVRLDDIRFYPGRYFIRLWVGGPDALETFDDRQDCLMLQVLDGGALTQRRLLRSQGFIFMQPRWDATPLRSVADDPDTLVG
jgi:lipopolysaccharide transport system ATP-binding protein